MEIYKQVGENPRTIRVSIERGDVVLSSQDFPSERLRGFVGGATDYSYDTTVKAADKDKLLLGLLVEKYRGDEHAVEGFRDWCKARGIPCVFSTWGSGQFD